jgi:hypothetical protein
MNDVRSSVYSSKPPLSTPSKEDMPSITTKLQFPDLSPKQDEQAPSTEQAPTDQRTCSATNQTHEILA